MKKNILRFGLISTVLLVLFAISGSAFAAETAHRRSRHYAPPPPVVHHHHGAHHGYHHHPPRHGHWHPHHYRARHRAPAVVVRPGSVVVHPFVGVYF